MPTINRNQPLAFPFTLRTALTIAAINLVLLGVYPQPFIAIAQNVVAPLVADAMPHQ